MIHLIVKLVLSCMHGSATVPLFAIPVLWSPLKKKTKKQKKKLKRKHNLTCHVNNVNDNVISMHDEFWSEKWEGEGGTHLKKE